MRIKERFFRLKDFGFFFESHFKCRYYSKMKISIGTYINSYLPSSLNSEEFDAFDTFNQSSGWLVVDYLLGYKGFVKYLNLNIARIFFNDVLLCFHLVLTSYIDLVQRVLYFQDGA